ncbi:MAG: hypothetical protein RLY31_123 [Bacteroidota bacterium]|jgi:glycosyltransferase involved in cell wall biosynthesis
MDNNRIFIVIPAKDEGPRIGNLLERLLELGYHNLVVVDDGSSDDTAAVAGRYPVALLSHIINLGAGAATQTGIAYALHAGADIIVTIDGDHQHLPHDIRQLVETLVGQSVDIVIGSRFLHKSNNIPRSRALYNYVGNVLTFLLTGLATTDSQSGMKAFRAEFARKYTIHRNGYEFCVEIIRNIRLHKAQWAEVPISVTYTPDTLAKGQNFWSGVKMLPRLFRYV